MHKKNDGNLNGSRGQQKKPSTPVSSRTNNKRLNNSNKRTGRGK